jgi:hypothetical protein
LCFRAELAALVLSGTFFAAAVSGAFFAAAVSGAFLADGLSSAFLDDVRVVVVADFALLLLLDRLPTVPLGLRRLDGPPPILRAGFFF